MKSTEKSMIGGEKTGMCMMALAGAGLAISVTLTTMVDILDLPYFSIAGLVGLTTALPMAGALLRSGELFKVQRAQWKWVWLRGFLGMSAYVASILAAAAGAPLGDISALSSLNIVVAAFLGAAFLKERLGMLHGFVILISIVGALLVAQPESLFSGRKDQPILGHTLGLLSGALSGSLYIAARKSIGINPVILTTSVMLQDSVMLISLPHTGFVHDKTWDRAIAQPERASLLFVGQGILFAGTCAALTIGAQLCPAHMSSTISTCVSMTLSYIAQVAIHGQHPSAPTILGAFMMTVAVGVMAANPSGSSAVNDDPAPRTMADAGEDGKAAMTKLDQVTNGMPQIVESPTKIYSSQKDIDVNMAKIFPFAMLEP